MLPGDLRYHSHYVAVPSSSYNDFHVRLFFVSFSSFSVSNLDNACASINNGPHVVGRGKFSMDGKVKAPNWASLFLISIKRVSLQAIDVLLIYRVYFFFSAESLADVTMTSVKLMNAK